jgi:hypothetical protein
MAEQNKETKHIPIDEWSLFFDRFINENIGRPVRIEEFGPSEGARVLADKVPLLSLNFDPGSEGGLTVSTGSKEGILYEHRIGIPRDIWVKTTEAGQDEAVEVIDEEGTRSVLTLAA